MSRPSLILAALTTTLAACAIQEADCPSAVQHVTSCYGADIGSAFAQTCTPEAAATALDEPCPSDGPDDGKSDLFSTPILSPAVEQFKYGSIGADKLGLPLVLMKALPLVCKDLLPAGAPSDKPLTAFGMIYEPGHELPIGFSSRKLPMIGITLVGTTCSACHTSTVRASADGSRTMYFGAPATRFDLAGYNAFLMNCITDPSRFNATTLNAAFDTLGVHGLDRLLAYSSSFVNAFVSDLKTKVNSVVKDGPWGPGRDDAIGLSAAILLGPQYLPAAPAPVDFPAVWNQQARHGHALHWDGAAGSAQERNVLVAVGAGTPKSMVPLASIAAIQSWLDALPAPKYPFPIDATLASKGATIFAAKCNSCHGADGSRTWSVIDLAEVGTDPNRVRSVTQAGIDQINKLSGAGWSFSQFKKTNGYMTNLLDGIWLRAPYLHNGSVPTLRDLLLPAAQRPTTFHRGNDTYDQTAVGFVTNLDHEGSTVYSTFDTARQGNSNSGHEYGTDMSPADRDALLEYLKTL